VGAGGVCGARVEGLHLIQAGGALLAAHPASECMLGLHWASARMLVLITLLGQPPHAGMGA